MNDSEMYVTKHTMEQAIRKARIETARKCADLAKQVGLISDIAALGTASYIEDAILAYAASLEEGTDEG